jgi:hypothetical protein
MTIQTIQQSANDPTRPKMSIDKSFVRIGFRWVKLSGLTALLVLLFRSEKTVGASVGVNEGLKFGFVGSDVG